MLTYVNAGDVDVYGADFSIKAFLDDKWTLSATASFVSDDYFDLGDGSLGSTEVEGGIVPIALNAPKTKGTVSLAYRDARVGFNAEARVRITSGFRRSPPDSSGRFPVRPRPGASFSRKRVWRASNSSTSRSAIRFPRPRRHFR